MPVRPVILYPDPCLKLPCGEIANLCDAARIAHDLVDTMDAAPPRTVGIAAPQIAEQWRVAVVDTSRNPKYPPGHGPMTLINPKIALAEGMQTFREGCLSIPEFTANISRAMRVTVRFTSPDGEAREVVAEGFEAVVLQHEIDHLDGILFLDRVKSLKDDLFRRK